MLKIGEFSKLSHLTVKALRFYEKEGLLEPAFTDEWTNYRFYETGQLADAASIKAYRQLGLSIEEIKAIRKGADKRVILTARAEVLKKEKEDLDTRLSLISHLLEDRELTHEVTEKVIPECIVYYTDLRVDAYGDLMSIIPELGAECAALNPGIKCCAEPGYDFCEYLDGEYRESDIHIRHNEAVDRMGKESDRIKFRKLPATKVLSVFHRGHYDRIGEAYSFIFRYAEENGYTQTDPVREVYLDGIWNKDSEEDWLTEIQLPVE